MHRPTTQSLPRRRGHTGNSATTCTPHRIAPGSRLPGERDSGGQHRGQPDHPPAGPGAAGGRGPVWTARPSAAGSCRRSRSASRRAPCRASPRWLVRAGSRPARGCWSVRIARPASRTRPAADRARARTSLELRRLRTMDAMPAASTRARSCSPEFPRLAEHRHDRPLALRPIEALSDVRIARSSYTVRADACDEPTAALLEIAARRPDLDRRRGHLRRLRRRGARRDDVLPRRRLSLRGRSVPPGLSQVALRRRSTRRPAGCPARSRRRAR